MVNFSEYVSIGHPDKVADYISEYLLDKWISVDKDVHYAVEVQIKDNFVTLGGEVSSLVNFTGAEIEKFVKEAVDEIGYDKKYQESWGVENTISGDSLNIVNHIGQQSPTIALGVYNKGWGDQGIFFGYAVPNKETEYMPYDYALARRINKFLFESVIENNKLNFYNLGLDIKTEVITEKTEGTEIVQKVIIAIPFNSKFKDGFFRQDLEANIKSHFPETEYAEFTINGTGAYLSHSSIADCGTTGRKLVVDFYGGNAKIGGGSPWTKDGSKADLTLNLYARYLAKNAAHKYNVPVECSIACCIGLSQILVSIKNIDTNQIIKEYTKTVEPQTLIEKFHLDTPIYTSMCKWGLFGEFQTDKAWEKIEN